ncbi:porin family protein [Oceanicaulis alexandrii]|uniref:porin family protein n=1 Tax=Oceanicaulis alexandrii TaxID=153233 RepID=UPI0003B5FEFE|nr:porin family protein [Oceanicaulis alexandrii]
MQKTILLSTAAALLIAGGASAQDSKWHLGAGYTYFDASDVELDVINIRGGYDITEYFGVEGELLVGLEDEDLTIAGVSGDVGLDYGLGVFAKAQYPLAEQVSVYGRLGYAYHEIDASFAGAQFEDSSDAFAFGGGLEWTVSGPNAVRLDYTRYEYEGDGDADAFSIGYVLRF